MDFLPFPHTEAESSAKRSCQGTLSRGADASGERKVETMSENEERCPRGEMCIRKKKDTTKEDTIKDFKIHLLLSF